MRYRLRPGRRQGPRHAPAPDPAGAALRIGRLRISPVAVVIVAAVMAVAVGVAVVVTGHTSDPGGGGRPAYVGLFAPPAPASYSGINAFTATTGVAPDLLVYYSAWQEPFRIDFATQVARHHAVPLVQIDPTDIRIGQIASGRYDAYLRSYASEVRGFGHRVVLSFGHEMNGYWYSWGYRRTSPAVFVAAWRHIVRVFRAAGASNVTWLWTVNIIRRGPGIPPLASWWPGNSYVNWVGIDGYYLKPSWKFAPLFGPTIKAVRALTLDRILIAETAATPAASKPAKIANLFAGIRAYGLLGFVWFDSDKHRNWGLAGPAAIAAFRRGARSLTAPGS